jgi:metal-responsive CopG/Arc/MetJ family transcriptional regulator
MEKNEVQISQGLPVSLDIKLKVVAGRLALRRSRVIRKALFNYVESSENSETPVAS